MREATRTPTTALKELKASVVQMGERWRIHNLKTARKKCPIEFPQRYVEDSKVDGNRLSFEALNGWPAKARGIVAER